MIPPFCSGQIAMVGPQWADRTMGARLPERSARILMATSVMKNLKAVSTEIPELSERFDRVLQSVVDAMEGASLTYLFIGGVASGGLGRPRSTADIDIFIRPEDREKTLRALESAGFETQKTDPVWLYKAFKENILVDVIFKSKGEIYLDQPMYQHRTTAEFHGKKLCLASPEDMILIKVLAHAEDTPGHWHDALALLSHAEIDWNYLLQRARKAPRRVLSLLLYAQSNDLWVPDAVVSRLYQDIFGAGRWRNPASTHESRPADRGEAFRQLECVMKYEIERLKEDYATHEELGELNVEVAGEVRSGLPYLVLRGETMSEESKNLLTILATRRFPEGRVDNQVRVIEPLEWSREAS